MEKQRINLEPSDMYLVNGFVVHNFKNGGVPPEGGGSGGGDFDFSPGPQGKRKGQKVAGPTGGGCGGGLGDPGHWWAGQGATGPKVGEKVTQEVVVVQVHKDKVS